MISSLLISTALNTKSTVEAISSTSLTFLSVRSATLAGIGVSIFHLPSTASLYFFPALRGDAATVTTSNQGWFSRRAINLCPTIPVAPRIPTLNFSIAFSSFIFLLTRYILIALTRYILITLTRYILIALTRYTDFFVSSKLSKSSGYSYSRDFLRKSLHTHIRSIYKV